MASGDTLLVFHPQDHLPPASDFPSLLLRNRHAHLTFDSGTDEETYFSGMVPQAYASGGVKVLLSWAADGVTSGDVRWAAGFERVEADNFDIDADGFAANNGVTDTAPATDGHVTVAEIPFTDGADMDNVAKGDNFRLLVKRDADNAADTMSADAQLFRIEIRES